MAEDSRLVQHKHSNGTTYVYEIISNVWDPGKKQSRNKQVCIGKIDPDTGELIPSRRLKEDRVAAVDPAVTARTSVSGPAMVLNKIADDAELTKVFRKAFPDTWQQILSLAWYMTSTGDALSHAESWCRNHEVPGNKVLSSLRISELLSKMREDERQTFFKLWGRQASEKDYLCYDIPRFPPTRNRMNDLKV